MPSARLSPVLRTCKHSHVVTLIFGGDMTVDMGTAGQQREL